MCLVNIGSHSKSRGAYSLVKELRNQHTVEPQFWNICHLEQFSSRPGIPFMPTPVWSVTSQSLRQQTKERMSEMSIIRFLKTFFLEQPSGMNYNQELRFHCVYLSPDLLITKPRQVFLCSFRLWERSCKVIGCLSSDPLHTDPGANLLFIQMCRFVGCFLYSTGSFTLSEVTTVLMQET